MKFMICIFFCNDINNTCQSIGTKTYCLRPLDNFHTFYCINIDLVKVYGIARAGLSYHGYAIEQNLNILTGKPLKHKTGISRGIVPVKPEIELVSQNILQRMSALIFNPFSRNCLYFI